MNASTENPNKSRPKWLLWAGLGLLAAGLIAGWFLLPVKEWAEAFQKWIEGLGVWGVVAFGVAYVVATVLAIPASPLTLVAGLAFGMWGFPLVVVAATIGAALAFLVARYLAREKVKAMVEKRPKLKAVDQAVTDEGWKIVALMRLSPLVPFNLQNYLFGVTEVDFKRYVAATFVGIMPGSMLYVYVGSLGQQSGGGTTGKWIFFALGLIATAITVVLITRKAKARLAEAGVGGDKAQTPSREKS
ncbi:MAG: TVP38/TMEM64 family protein [Pseudomonadota bacterium]|nr:TVP38/TMEM64 family protein [Pseudomonadota bacterium]